MGYREGARKSQQQRWENLAQAARFDANELARLCQISTRHLEREFRRRLGRTPQDWLNERRIVAATQLLLSGLPIKAVAFEVGFKQPSHFSRHFKLHLRMTPSQFTFLNEASRKVGHR
jgi:transcriptional regulator GlxA family with amidase domain